MKNLQNSTSIDFDGLYLHVSKDSKKNFSVVTKTSNTTSASLTLWNTTIATCWQPFYDEYQKAVQAQAYLKAKLRQHSTYQ